MARIGIVLTTPPYGNSQASEGLDFAMAATNYGHEVFLFFSGNGVLQLQTNLAGDEVTTNHAKRLQALPLYDIDTIVICQESLLQTELDSNNLAYSECIVTSDVYINSLKSCQHLVTF
jgi:tRNA 2-thiouridine synthesizing protein C